MTASTPAFAVTLRIRLLLTTACVCMSAASLVFAADETHGAGGVDVSASVVERKPGEGTVAGQVFDGDAGTPLAGVSVILKWPDPADGSNPKQDVQVTDSEGGFEFPSVPPGGYTITFIKSGFRTSTMKNIDVQADQMNRADFPLPQAPTAASDQVLQLEEFVVEASTVNEMMAALELRMDSDQLLNIMSAEELSKFAAGDVADALKRVAGVNIVDGKFAIIRGLEDRYSSTLYNHAPIPSPDPDRQSPQLDLFGSEIVGNIVVAKTAAPDLPSNSAGGSIDVVTHEYPEVFEFKTKLGTGFNDRASDRFIHLEDGRFIGTDDKMDQTDENEYGFSFGGRGEVGQREVRYKGVVNREVDFETAQGTSEEREPITAQTVQIPGGGRETFSGGLSQGELRLSGGKFDFTQSEREEQDTNYFGFGFDLDTGGNHKIDTSIFHTKNDQETAQKKENGIVPGAEYEFLSEKILDDDDPGQRDFAGVAIPGAWLTDSRDAITDRVARGPIAIDSFKEDKTFHVERDLLVTQVNGDHQIDALKGLHVSWATNWAKTTQSEESWGGRYYFEPCGFSESIACPEGVDRLGGPFKFPVDDRDLGPGRFVAHQDIFQSRNEIEEKQNFARLDGKYEKDVTEGFRVTVTAAAWWEKAERDVNSKFLDTPNFDDDLCTDCEGAGSQTAVLGDTEKALGETIANGLLVGLDGDFDPTRTGLNQSTREIKAWNLGGKATVLDMFDVFGGVRVEEIFIESKNDAFTGGEKFKQADIFPSRYTLFDRLDNPNRDRVPGTTGSSREISISERAKQDLAGLAFNDQILGISLPVTSCGGDFSHLLCVDPTTEQLRALTTGTIDEKKVLPSFGVAIRPIEGLTIRGAWSETVARPSFREMGYYVSVDKGSDDRTVGNPQLGLSEVESWDARAEFVWGDLGDLIAFSIFKKEIQDPIESIIVRDAFNISSSAGALFRTFFNNPSEAQLSGFELETRKSLGFLNFFGADFMQYISVGGNYTYIDAEVDRVPEELRRPESFFNLLGDDNAIFTGLKPTRRLFNQPEWIANADISLDHPGWGTKATLAYFAISDILDAAGTTTLSNAGAATNFTLDRYVDEFSQVDLILSQKWRSFTFKVSIKNLTDTERQIIYDPDQTIGTVFERRFKRGRDYSFSITGTF